MQLHRATEACEVTATLLLDPRSVVCSRAHPSSGVTESIRLVGGRVRAMQTLSMKILWWGGQLVADLLCAYLDLYLRFWE